MVDARRARARAAEDQDRRHRPALPHFRWPVHGRIIAGFGPKPSGQQNDGINVAVPEGTPIKAAEDGVVAYAGNELKGYGNLVLVRHSNGYVTAYAHASEIMVKRDDPVKRGQVIAKAGADRQRRRAATALRGPQGLDAGRSGAVPRRRQGDELSGSVSASRLSFDAEPSRQILHVLPGHAAGARAARGRPFQRLAAQRRRRRPECL